MIGVFGGSKGSLAMQAHLWVSRRIGCERAKAKATVEEGRLRELLRVRSLEASLFLVR
jgi:hypothetical protein